MNDNDRRANDRPVNFLTALFGVGQNSTPTATRCYETAKSL